MRKTVSIVATCLALACGRGPAPAPIAPRVAPSASVDLSTLVSAPQGTVIAWSVEAGGGSVTQAGLYTAPDCGALIAALPAGTDLAASGPIIGTEHVTASWVGGSQVIPVTIDESVAGVEVSPPSVTVEVGATFQFHATVHYACHDQTT